MRRAVAVLLTVLTFFAPAPPTATAWSSSQRCAKYEQLMVQHAPKGGWNVRRMSYYSWRESRCQPAIVNRTGNDTGLFQIHPVTWRWLAARFGLRYSFTTMQRWLKDPINNTRAAAALCEFGRRAFGDCYQPWRT